MNEKLKNLDFSKIDYSICQEEIQQMKNLYNSIKKDKKFIKKVEKYKKKNDLTFTYNNNLIISNYKKISSMPKIKQETEEKDQYIVNLNSSISAY